LIDRERPQVSMILEGAVGAAATAPAPDSAAVLPNLWRAVRPHQWTKNLLLLVALGTSHRYREWHSASRAVLAVLLFCFSSSSVYLWNDVLDRSADRQHPIKRKRPIASGALSLPIAVSVATLLAGISLAGMAWLEPRLAWVTVAYMAVSSLYSLWLKQLLVVDVVVLACLYVIRVIAGGLAIGVWLSFWTLAFSLFFFFSLALAKRYSELRNRIGNEGDSFNRRAYLVTDMSQLNMLGIASGLVAVCIVGFYIDGPEVRELYKHPAILWLLCPLLLWWCGRLWILAGRGEVNEDPVAFALRDSRSYLIGLLVVLTVLAAT
jgi:4-hydroxybenzoate polyprenyltransferase